MLIQAFCIGDFFSCVLKIELQSTRVHMYERKFWMMSYLVGVGLWWTWGCWCWFLDHSTCDHLPFLGQDSGGNDCRSLSSLEADWSKSGWTVIITFFIGGDPLQKSTSGAVGRKWNGSPVLVIGSGPSCCCKQGELELDRCKGWRT